MQESGSLEVTLCEDDPRAMIALLRYIYDLPYRTEGKNSWPTKLESYAELYITAGKYLVKDVQAEICVHLQYFSQHHQSKSVISDVTDFVKALRNIMNCTSSDEEARKLMVKACCVNLRVLQKDEGFLALLRDHGDLGAGIIGNRDFERALLGSWTCSSECGSDSDLICELCDRPFELDDLWAERRAGRWYCESCQGFNGARCRNCSEEVLWVQCGII
jgi:hypothetical protein